MELYEFNIPTDRTAAFKGVLAESNAFARNYPRHFTQLRPQLVSEAGGVAHFVVKIRNRQKVLFSELTGFIQDANDRLPLRRVARGRVY